MLKMTAFEKCHYQVLGVESNATGNEIKKSFRKLALQMHPDKNLHRTEEAKTEFQALQQAYETLSNPLKRALYDLRRTADLKDDSDSDDSDSDDSDSDDPDSEGADADYTYSYGSYSYDYYSYESPSPTKKPKWDSTYVPTGASKAIRDLNLNTNQVKIRARVTNKTDVRTWSNEDGEGKFFKMDLLDDSGEIRMTGFNTSVDSFYDRIHVNQVYYISWFKVKPANKQYTSLKHDYELTFSYQTRVTPCMEDASDIPHVTYDFVTIADVQNLEAGTIIDAIGVCKSVGDLQNATVRKTGKRVKKRGVFLMDQSGKEIALTLWEKTAKDFSDDTHPIIAVKGVKVVYFGGKCLSCLITSLFQVNPDLEQARALRRWYDGSNKTAESLGSARRGRNAGTTTPSWN